MRKRVGILQGVVGLFLVVLSVCAAVVPQEIPWSAHQRVAWDDFLGSPPPEAAAQAEAAAIYMTIRWSVSYAVTQDLRTGRWGGSVDLDSIDVSNTMQPHLSWAVSGKEVASVLLHEQGHFDLNEVYARRLVSALGTVGAQGATAEQAKVALKAAIDATAAQILDALQVAQKRYDAQTVHGTDPQAQDQWDARIRAWLLDPSLAPLSFD